MSLGLVQLGADGRYSLTDVGTLLDGDSPGSVRAGILFDVRNRTSTGANSWTRCARVRTCFSGMFQRRYGVDAWTSGPPMANGETVRRRDAGILRVAGRGRRRHLRLLRGWHHRRRGGGRGSLLAGILKAYPAARGALLDLPAVVADAPAILVAAGVAERCRVFGGSVLERVPSGGDAYILSVVIHDWDDESASALLTTCRRAMPESSRLLTRRARAFRGAERRRGAVFERPQYVAQLTVTGRERSETEYPALLAGSGFRLTHPVAMQSPFTILEARAGAETPTSRA